MMRYLQNPFLVWTFRLIVAGLFIAASLGKILNPHEFSGIIRKFHVMPHALSNTAAIFIPWVELVAAIGLFVPRIRKGAIWWMTLMLSGFIALFLWAMINGLDVDCGCFGEFGKYFALLAGDVGLSSIIRNAVLICFCRVLWVAEVNPSAQG